MSFYYRLEQIFWVIVIQYYFVHLVWSRRFVAVLLVSIVSLHSLQLVYHVMGNEQKKRLLFRLHLTSSTGTSNIKWPIHHLASSCISLHTEIAPLSPRKISASVSLLDSVWQNLRDSTTILLSMSSKSQCASRRLCWIWRENNRRNNRGNSLQTHNVLHF